LCVGKCIKGGVDHKRENTTSSSRDGPANYTEYQDKTIECKKDIIIPGSEYVFVLLSAV